MDSLSTQKTMSRKIKKLPKKSSFQILLDLFFRGMEIIVVLVTVAKLSYQLVITFEDSGVAAVILANRNLAFIVGNMIVIALVAKSRLLLNQELDPKCKSNDLYVEFYRESSWKDEISRADMRNRGKQIEEENKTKKTIIETRGKQIEEENKTKKTITETRVKQSQADTETQSISEKTTKQSIVLKMERSQSYQRSRSENLKNSCGRLKRSETEASFERSESDDELRFKIESFIARQRRNQKED